MEERGKIRWVTKAFAGLMEQVRPGDLVSLVVFDVSARILVPPMQVETAEDKEQFMDRLASLRIGGKSNIYRGMALGYAQVAANYREGAVNRVICLSDGDHNAGDEDENDILALVETYRRKDITLSTIALGEEADRRLMEAVALRGGGIARFITEPDAMAEAFGRRLDRLVLPGTVRLTVELRLAQGVELAETWGYEHQILGNRVRYTLGPLYTGERKTLAAEVYIASGLLQKPFALGSWYVEYRDPAEELHRQGPYPIMLTPQASPGKELTHPWIRESEGFIRSGRTLMNLRKEALEIRKHLRAYERLTRYGPPKRTFRTNNNGLIPVTDESPWSQAQVKGQLLESLRRALQEVEEIAAYLERIEESLGRKSYTDPRRLLTRYRETFQALYARYAAED
jgi:hypothetical protein